MIVIPDSTPIITLCRIQRLHLLRDLDRSLVIPEAVYREVVDAGRNRPGVSEVPLAEGIEVRHVSRPLPAGFSEELGDGELEAIALALEERDHLLIIDEIAGRREALTRGLRIIGTLGILRDAKLTGFLVAIRPELEKLKLNRFHLSDELFREILSLAKK